MGSAVLGPYRLDAVLSDGPSAIVYTARDTRHHDRVVALKVFSHSLSADAGFRARFRRDAGLLSALREPHVVPIHRYGEIDGRLYLDMRVVRGPSLAKALRAGPLDPVRARSVGQQITAACDALRRGGLGDRLLERDDVLLTGAPGHGEFVQLVGLGLGRPPAAARADVPALLRPPAGWAPPRPRRCLRRGFLVAAAVVSVAAALATALVAHGLRARGAPAVTGPLVATITDTPGGVRDLATSELDGRPVLVAITGDGSVRSWDAHTGEAAGPVIPGDARALETAAIDGRPVAVGRHGDATLHVHDLATGTPVGAVIGEPEPGGRPVTWLTAGPAGLATVEHGGAPLAVTARETGASVTGPVGTPSAQVGVQAFALPGGAPAGPLVAEDGYSLDTYAVAEVDGRPVVATVAGRTRLQVRDLATGALVGVAPPPQPADVHALAIGVRDGAPVVLTGGADNVVRIWDLRTGELVGSPLAGHTAALSTLATVRLGDRTVVISTASAVDDPERAEVRFWDLATGAALGSPPAGHPLARGFAAAIDGERALLVAARPGEPITVWDAQQLIEGDAP